MKDPYDECDQTHTVGTTRVVKTQIEEQIFFIFHYSVLFGKFEYIFILILNYSCPYISRQNTANPTACVDYTENFQDFFPIQDDPEPRPLLSKRRKQIMFLVFDPVGGLSSVCCLVFGAVFGVLLL